MVKQEEPIKIEIEDLEAEPVKAETQAVDLAEELRRLGRQVGETVQTTWNSADRQRLESEIREGFKNFVEEMGKIIDEVKTSPAAQRVREEASRVETGEITGKAKTGLAQSLQWLSRELARLSDKLNAREAEPQEKAPPAE